MDFLHAYLGLMLCVAAIFTGFRTGQEGPHGAPGAGRVAARTSPLPQPNAAEPSEYPKVAATI